jgi:sulfite reductase (NADPH) hemoprotein beta-component
VLAASVLLLVLNPLMSAVGAADRTRAVFLAMQGHEAARAIKENLWTDLTLGTHGLAQANRRSPLRLNAMACVALPTCALAMAESERYLPSLVTRIEALLERHALSGEPITLRMTGCPNGCARPYLAEIGLTGRAPGKYNLYLGAGFHGERLNRMYRENIGEAAILEALDHVLGRYAAERLPGERLGDFTMRAGIVKQ